MKIVGFIVLFKSVYKSLFICEYKVGRTTDAYPLLKSNIAVFPDWLNPYTGLPTTITEGNNIITLLNIEQELLHMLSVKSIIAGVVLLRIYLA